MPDGATLYMKGSSVGTGASTCATGSAAGITDTSAGKNADKQAKKALTKLISKGMSGDEGAFIALFERSVKEIYYLANALLDNKAETDDVVQEVAIALYKGMTKLQSPYAFTSFLVSTTRYVCLSHNRKQMRHRHDSIDKDELDVLDDEKYTPEAVSDAESLAGSVRMFVRRLPEKQRVSILLYYYYDLSYKEIAETTGSTVSAVGTSINKAKKALRKMIKEHKQNNRQSEVFHGVAVAPLLTAAFVGEFDDALSNEAATLHVKAVAESIHLLAHSVPAAASPVGAAAASRANSLAVKIIIGVVGVVLVAAAAIATLPQVLQPQAEPAPAVSEDAVAPFTAEVEIILGETLPAGQSSEQSSDQGQDTRHYPASARVQASEGTPGMWSILDENGAVAAEGSGSSIDESVFSTLPVGSYVIEWVIEGESGQYGIAQRVIDIY